MDPAIIATLAGLGITYIGAKVVGGKLRPVMAPRPMTGMVWKWPQKGGQREGKTKPSKERSDKFRPFGVRPSERVAIYRTGELFAIVPEGYWQSTRLPFEKLELFWVDVSQRKINYGVKQAVSRDGFMTGINGTITITVDEDHPQYFINQLVKFEPAYTEQQLTEFVRDFIADTLKPSVSELDFLELLKNPKHFQVRAFSELNERLMVFGLNVVEFTAPGVMIPPDFEKSQEVLWAADRKNKEEAVRLKEAEIMAKETVLLGEAQAEVAASRRKKEGLADVEVMSALNSAGIDPVAREAVRTFMEYARHPSTGGGVVPPDLYKPQVFMGLMDVLKNKSVPSGVKEQIYSQLPENTQKEVEQEMGKPSPGEGAQEKVPGGEAGGAQEPPAEEPEGAMSVDEMLRSLDMKLAKGEISEDTYLEIKKRWTEA